MEHIALGTPSRSLVRDVQEPRCGKIRKQNLALLRRLTANAFGEVSNAEVHGICGFIPEQGDLSLV